MQRVMRENVDLHTKPGPIEKALQRLEEMVRGFRTWFKPEAVVEFGDPSYGTLDVARERIRSSPAPGAPS